MPKLSAKNEKKQAERIIKKLQKKERMYKYALKRGENGVPLTKEEEKTMNECLKVIIKLCHPRS
jgi:hypothetical protein